MTEAQIKTKFEKYAAAHAPTEAQANNLWERIQSGKSRKLSFSTFTMRYKLILPVILLAVLLAPAAGYWATQKSGPLLSPVATFDRLADIASERDSMQPQKSAGGAEAPSMGNNKGNSVDDYYYRIEDKDKNYNPSSEYQQKRGNFTFTTHDVNATKAAVEKMVGEFAGVVTSSRYLGSNYAQAAYTVQIPVDKFSSFVASLRTINAKITQEDITLSDRQEEFDLLVSERTKLVAKRDELQRQLTAATTAGQREDIRAQLKNIEAQIKTVETRQNGIKQDTQFSQVSIVINSDTSGFSWQEWVRGEQILESFGFMVMFWLNVVIWAAVPVGLIWLAVQAWKNRGKKKQAKSD